MTDPTVPPHVAHEIRAPGGGTVPILPMLLLLATAIIGGLTAWLFRIDDRLYGIIRDVPTRQEIQQLRNDLTSRLDRIDSSLSSALERPKPPTHP